MEGSGRGVVQTEKSPPTPVSDGGVPKQESPPSWVYCHVLGCREEIPFPPGKKPKRAVQTCRTHRSASSVDINGVPHRFCQHCTRMHCVAEFEGGKRTCKAHLLRRNLRRRKRAKETRATAAAKGTVSSGTSSKRAAQNIRPKACEASAPAYEDGVLKQHGTAAALVFSASDPVQHRQDSSPAGGEVSQGSRPRPSGMRWSSTASSGQNETAGASSPQVEQQQEQVASTCAPLETCTRVRWAGDDNAANVTRPYQPLWLVPESDSGYNKSSVCPPQHSPFSIAPMTAASEVFRDAAASHISQQFLPCSSQQQDTHAVRPSTHHGVMREQDITATQSELWQEFIRSGWSAGQDGPSQQDFLAAPFAMNSAAIAASREGIACDRANPADSLRTDPSQIHLPQRYGIHELGTIIRESHWPARQFTDAGHISSLTHSCPQLRLPRSQSDQIHYKPGSASIEPGHSSLWQIARENSEAALPTDNSLSDIAFEMVQNSAGWQGQQSFSLQQRYGTQVDEQEALRRQSSSNNSNGPQ